MNGEWIPVAERMPEDGVVVMAWDGRRIGPRPLTKLQPDGGIAGPLHRVVMRQAR